jgi:hypothetical protein
MEMLQTYIALSWKAFLCLFVIFDAVQSTMILATLLATLVSLASWTKPVAASLRVTADHHSFGGVNYPQLQFFTPSHRDETIREIVKSGARVIRLFSEFWNPKFAGTILTTCQFVRTNNIQM